MSRRNRNWLKLVATVGASVVSMSLLVGTGNASIAVNTSGAEPITVHGAKKKIPICHFFREGAAKPGCSGGSMAGIGIASPRFVAGVGARARWGYSPKYYSVTRTRPVTKTKMKRVARKKNVRVPSPTSKKAKKNKNKKYKAYEIWTTHEKTYSYKIGFVKKKSAPGTLKRQEKKCRKGMPSSFGCGSHWVRRNIKGWYRAKMWQMAYVARHKRQAGTCPLKNKNICY